MSDKKITLSPEHMERLRVLMRAEQARVDALGDDEAELARMESELQESLRTLARNSSMPAQDTEFEQHWARMESRLKPQIEAASHDTGAKVVALQKKKHLMPWFGALAAAAIALFILIPRQRSGIESAPEFAVKGSATSWSADCEVKVIDAPSLHPSADGFGYEGPVNATFQLAVRCDRGGLLHIKIDGPEPQDIRGIPVVAGESTGVMLDGKLASFSLKRDVPWVFSVLLSVDAIAGKLPVTETEAQGLRGLWFDRITVKGTEQ